MYAMHVSRYAAGSAISSYFLVAAFPANCCFAGRALEGKTRGGNGNGDGFDSHHQVSQDDDHTMTKDVGLVMLELSPSLEGRADRNDVSIYVYSIC